MTTLIPKTSPPFCHEWQRVSNSSSNVVVIKRASILILIIIIVVGVIIIVLVLKCIWRRKGRLYEATKLNLPTSNTADTGFHLIQLSSECIKASIHALKLRHDRLEGYTTHRWRRCECGRSARSRKSHCLYPWPLRLKLGLAPSDGSSVYGTHNHKMRRLGIGDKKNGEKASW